MKFVFYLIKFSGIPYLIRELIQKRSVTILLYHDISVSNAALHFNYLKKNYNLISLQDFISAYNKNEVSSLPKKSLIITLDDGHKGNYKLLPLIIELKIPVTIFLCSHIICTNKNFWFKHEYNNVSIEKIKKMKNAERLDYLKSKGFEQEKEYENRNALSLDEIKEMAPYVDFQSHSMTHPCLPLCTSGESESEIRESKQMLEKLLNKKINTFSYPNGDYSVRETEYLKQHGYEAGITCDLWFNNNKTDRYRLKRLDCQDDASLVELEVKVTGAFIFLKRLLFGQDFGYKKNPA